MFIYMQVCVLDNCTQIKLEAHCLIIKDTTKSLLWLINNFSLLRIQGYWTCYIQAAQIANKQLRQRLNVSVVSKSNVIDFSISKLFWGYPVNVISFHNTTIVLLWLYCYCISSKQTHLLFCSLESNWWKHVFWTLMISGNAHSEMTSLLTAHSLLLISSGMHFKVYILQNWYMILHAR